MNSASERTCQICGESSICARPKPPRTHRALTIVAMRSAGLSEPPSSDFMILAELRRLASLAADEGARCPWAASGARRGWACSLLWRGLFTAPLASGWAFCRGEDLSSRKLICKAFSNASYAFSSIDSLFLLFAIRFTPRYTSASFALLPATAIQPETHHSAWKPGAQTASCRGPGEFRSDEIPAFSSHGYLRDSPSGRSADLRTAFHPFSEVP